MLIYLITIDHIDNNSTKERWRREIENRYIRIPEQPVVYDRNEQNVGILCDGIMGWISRLSIGFGGVHRFRGTSNMAWKGPFCLCLPSLCYRLSLSCTRWHGRRLAGRVLTVAALTPLAHSLGSGSHRQYVQVTNIKFSNWKRLLEHNNRETIALSTSLYFFT